MAVPLSLGPATLHATLLGCTQAAVDDDPLRQQSPGLPQEHGCGPGQERLHSLHSDRLTIIRASWGRASHVAEKLRVLGGAGFIDCEKTRPLGKGMGVDLAKSDCTPSTPTASQ